MEIEERLPKALNEVNTRIKKTQPKTRRNKIDTQILPTKEYNENNREKC